jgi:hypothetical protein
MPLLRSFALLFVPVLAAAPAGLNHFYSTVDTETFAAIEASPFLREQFAPFEKRTTVRNDSTYSGLYFYGLGTYFEFFEEGQGERKKGDAGMALGVEEAGGSEQLRAQWNAVRPAVVTTVTRQVGGAATNWFRMTSFEETRANSAVPGLRLFAMEYAPTFLKVWGAGPEGSIRMADILGAYCDKLGLAEMRKNAKLANVSRVEIAGPAAGLELRAKQLELAGWKVTRRRGGVWECVGPNATVVFRPAPVPQSVRRVEFQLQHPYNGPDMKLGSSTLRFRERTAVWTF